MNTSHSARLKVSQRFAASAFTLLELLVVISIIAVLAGILLPVTGSVMETARKTTAKNTVQQIVTAVKAFQTDYGVYPVPPNTTAANPPTDTTFKGDTNSGLFTILRATETTSPAANTRRVVYFEGKDVKNSAVPKDGFATKVATTKIGTNSFSVPIGTLVDPWGVGYMVRYDTGYDDAVMLPQTEGSSPNTSADSTSATTSNTTNGVLRFGVIAWSYGKDGVPGTQGKTFDATNPLYGDDVVSWQ